MAFNNAIKDQGLILSWLYTKMLPLSVGSDNIHICNVGMYGNWSAPLTAQEGKSVLNPWLITNSLKYFLNEY